MGQLLSVYDSPACGIYYPHAKLSTHAPFTFMVHDISCTHKLLLSYLISFEKKEGKRVTYICHRIGV